MRHEAMKKRKIKGILHDDKGFYPDRLEAIKADIDRMEKQKIDLTAAIEYRKDVLRRALEQKGC
jgi:hypothetical protein